LAAGLILPRVQAARADAARAQCQENLRKLGQGFAEFEKTHGGFPARRVGFNDGAPYSGWGALLLPHIGEADLAQKYNPKLDWFDPGNKAVVETRIKAFLCPASPDKRMVTVQSQASAKSENADKDTVFTVNGAVNDYIASNGILLPRGGYGLNANVADEMIGNARQATTDNEYLPLAKITDGLSCTLLVIEQAGRPEIWRNGKKQDGNSQFGMSANARGAWAGWGSIAFGAANAKTGETPGLGDATDCTVNCNNWFGIYGFHTGGANVLMCDGSVRFVSPKLDPLTLMYLTIRDDGHVISTYDY
jgi:prepilin-type processing-associated H-X9-DG protein